jgi:hypothetical protein
LNFQREGRESVKLTELLEKILNYYSPFFLVHIASKSVGKNETLCQRIQLSLGTVCAVPGDFSKCLFGHA